MEDQNRQVTLVVDDEQDMCEIVAGVCEHSGYKALVANNGLEAMKVLSENDVDFVISDVMMPKMTGLQLLTKVKQKNPYIPFLIMTGYSAQQLALEALVGGAFDLIYKPFEIPLFNQIVREVARVAAETKHQFQNIKFDPLDRNESSAIESNAIAEIKRIKVLSEVEQEKEKGDSLKVENSEERFVSEFKKEALVKLKEAEQALIGVSKDSEWEIGFLFRVYHSIHKVSSMLGYKKMAKLSDTLQTTFANFRIRPRLLKREKLQTLRHCNQVLILLAKSVPEEAESEVIELADQMISKVQSSSFGKAS